jgi:ribonuclease HII
MFGVAAIGEEGIQQLLSTGVTDSKTLDIKSRNETYGAIDKCNKVEVFFYTVQARDIDRAVESHNLNKIEREMARTLIFSCANKLGKPDAIILDGKNIFSSLMDEYPQAIAVDKAENKHITVAAASVMAKVQRDYSLQTTYQMYGWKSMKGNGYCNEGTEQFLRYYYQKHRDFPVELRRSFSWSKRIMDKIRNDYC